MSRSLSPPAREDPQSPPRTLSVGLVGARGHTGRELLRLIAGHPRLALAFAASRELAGRSVRELAPEIDDNLCFVDAAPVMGAAEAVDVLILALPNGLSDAYVDAATGRTRIIIDLSADHRFDDGWIYGLPELNETRLRQARLIANPGCYATAMMLALAPLVDDLDGVPHIFGVSGYSGAGTTPSPRNDPEVLRDNVVPYQLTDHLHEREVAHHLGCPLRFAPHVAPFFRGISATILATLREPTTIADLRARYDSFYADKPLVRMTGETVPLVRDAAHRIGACIGGLAVSATDSRRISVVATLDNLLKGAASQAIQNLNLACGLEPQEGLRDDLAALAEVEHHG